MKKVKVLFVGSFINKAIDGSVGGQMYACRSLVASNVSNYVEWILLDTTAKSVPPPSVYIRGFYALVRLIKFLLIIVVKRPKYSLIFSANGASIIEKGMMVLISKTFGITCFFAPRGGPIVSEIEKSSLLIFFLKLFIRKSDYIICQGIFWKSFFEKLVPDASPSKFKIVSNWIDLKKYPYQTRIAPRNEKLNTINILFMGWMQKEKGIFEIYESLVRLKLNNYLIKVSFLGDGNDKNKMIELCKNLAPNYLVTFPGWVYGEQKLKYLNESDIFLLPSYAEGMPNSLMEAMACGIPSIASNVGAIPEMISNMETGILVEPGNSIELSNALSFLISNPIKREEISRNARLIIEKKHSLVFAEREFISFFNK